MDRCAVVLERTAFLATLPRWSHFKGQCGLVSWREGVWNSAVWLPSGAAGSCTRVRRDQERSTRRPVSALGLLPAILSYAGD